MTAWEKANRSGTVLKKNSYQSHYKEDTRGHGSLTIKQPVKCKLYEYRRKCHGGKCMWKIICTVKKTGHSWRIFNITAETGSHCTAAKQEITKQHLLLTYWKHRHGPNQTDQLKETGDHGGIYGANQACVFLFARTSVGMAKFLSGHILLALRAAFNDLKYGNGPTDVY